MDFESSKSSSSSNAGTIEHSWKYGAGGAVPMENTYSDSSNRSSDSPPSSCSTVSTGGSSISGTMGSTYVSSYYGIEEDLEPHSRSTPLSQIMGATYASSYYGSIPPKPENLRPTPSSLLWSEDLEISDYYNLQMPATGSKEPYLLLLEYFPETSFAPRVVYLDSDPYVFHASSLPATCQILITFFNLSNPRKHSHPCQVPGRACWKRLGTRPVFSRPADLMRHYANFHGARRRKGYRVITEIARASKAPMVAKTVIATISASFTRRTYRVFLPRLAKRSWRHGVVAQTGGDAQSVC